MRLTMDMINKRLREHKLWQREEAIRLTLDRITLPPTKRRGSGHNKKSLPR